MVYLIYVQKHGQSEFSVKFKPVKQNLDRMRAIPTATFDGEKSWICELRFFNEFEDAFKGEIIYMTLRHELLGHPPPPVPAMYKKIPKHPINGIKAPYTLYDYQKFGANFLACIAGGTGHAFLIDGVGTGR